MAIRFDNAADMLSRTASVPSGSTVTIRCFAKLSVDSNNFSTIWSLDANATSSYWYLQTDSDGVTLKLWDDGGGAPHTITGPTLVVGTWYYLAATLSGANAAIYWCALPGSTLSSATASNFETVVGTASFKIGDSPWTGEDWNGCVTALAIWSGVALTSAELQRDMMQLEPQIGSSLWAFYSMAEVASATTDETGNGRSLTSAGTLTTENGPPVRWSLGRQRPLVYSASAPPQSVTAALAAAELAGVAPSAVPGTASFVPALTHGVGSIVAPSASPGSVAVAPALAIAQESSPAPSAVPSGPPLVPVLASAAVTSASPSVSPGAVSVAPTLAHAAENVSPATVSTGAASVAPTLTIAQEALPAPSAALGASSIDADTTSAVGALVTPVVAPGAVSVAPDAVKAPAHVVAPSVAVSGLSVRPDVVGTALFPVPPGISAGTVSVSAALAIGQFASFVPSTTLAISPQAFSASGSVYAPAATVGAVSVAPALVTAVAHVPAQIVGIPETLIIAPAWVAASGYLHASSVSNPGLKYSSATGYSAIVIASGGSSMGTPPGQSAMATLVTGRSDITITIGTSEIEDE